MNALPIYSGYAEIYIEGKGVLVPHVNYSPVEIIYSIGSEDSKFRIIDHRGMVNKMAVSTIEKQGADWFPELFCTPCYINVTREDDDIIVELQDWNKKEIIENPLILWAGVFQGDELQANPVLFLQFADLGDERTAFVGLVDPSYVEMALSVD